MEVVVQIIVVWSGGGGGGGGRLVVCFVHLKEMSTQAEMPMAIA